MNNAKILFDRSYESEGKARGYSCSYRIRLPDSERVFVTDIYGNARTRPTLVLEEGCDEPEFSIHPKRRILNSTYVVREGERGRTLGTVRQCGGFSDELWTVVDEHEDDFATVRDPSSLSVRAFRQLLQGARKAYAIQFAAGHETLLLEHTLESHNGAGGGFLARFNRLLRSKSIWALHAYGQDVDFMKARLLISTCLLIQEINVVNDKSQ